MCTLGKFIDTSNTDIWKQGWIQAWDFGLAREWDLTWELFIHEIHRDHIEIIDDSDEISWVFKKSWGYYIPNIEYISLSSIVLEDPRWRGKI